MGSATPSCRWTGRALRAWGGPDRDFWDSQGDFWPPMQEGWWQDFQMEWPPRPRPCLAKRNKLAQGHAVAEVSLKQRYQPQLNPEAEQYANMSSPEATAIPVGKVGGHAKRMRCSGRRLSLALPWCVTLEEVPPIALGLSFPFVLWGGCPQSSGNCLVCQEMGRVQNSC